MSRRSSSFGMVCPPADSRGMVLPSLDGNPRVDDHFAPAETRVEYIQGVEVFAAPAHEPHARLHSQINRVVGAYVKEPYTTAVDMLTRVDEATDFAPDVAVYEPIIDPETGEVTGRQLEEIAFEILDKQKQAVPTKKALMLVARGVRRVFCLVVKGRKLSEWSRAHGRWEPIPPDAMIEDPCFVAPIKAGALMDSVLAEDAIGRAMLAKDAPSVVAALNEKLAKGLERGAEQGALEQKRADILQIFQHRGIAVSKAVQGRIASETNFGVLEEWVKKAITAKHEEELFEKKRS
ncbi:MAG: Uma2 family endonuclease [Polyangiaceae bacterium]|nr:Uma2 family endonuclease [Polyangiaceae bacterium]